MTSGVVASTVFVFVLPIHETAPTLLLLIIISENGPLHRELNQWSYQSGDGRNAVFDFARTKTQEL